MDAEDAFKQPSKLVDAMKCREELISKKLYDFFFFPKIDFPAVVVGNTSIPRPAGSTFRVVDEIFLCNKYRQNTEGKQFLFYGFVRDKADVKYCQCIVHEPLTRVTRTAPLVCVAHIPNGKFARQTLEQISEADTKVYAWMQEVLEPETPMILQPQIFR